MISESTIVANNTGFLLRAVGRDDIALESEQSIGRESDCDIRIVDKTISRYHARISITRVGMVVEDLGSTNGTYLNGVRIQRAMGVSLGDTLRFHNIVYRVVSHCSDDADATVYVGNTMHTVSLKVPEPVPVGARCAKQPAKPSCIARKAVLKRTAIERQLLGQLQQDESTLKRIAELATGVWIEFREFNGRAYACCILSAGGKLGERCVLVPVSGFGVIDKSCGDIGIDIEHGKARILEVGPWYGRLALFLTGALRRVARLEDANCA